MKIRCELGCSGMHGLGRRPIPRTMHHARQVGLPAGQSNLAYLTSWTTFLSLLHKAFCTAILHPAVSLYSCKKYMTPTVTVVSLYKCTQPSHGHGCVHFQHSTAGKESHLLCALGGWPGPWPAAELAQPVARSSLQEPQAESLQGSCQQPLTFGAAGAALWSHPQPCAPHSAP